MTPWLSVVMGRQPIPTDARRPVKRTTRYCRNECGRDSLNVSVTAASLLVGRCDKAGIHLTAELHHGNSRRSQ
jgi:hypothetical protein